MEAMYAKDVGRKDMQTKVSHVSSLSYLDGFRDGR